MPVTETATVSVTGNDCFCGGNYYGRMVKRIGQDRAVMRKTYFREWREFRGLSQEALAEKLGTNKSGVSKIENGQNYYNQSSLEAWADALGCEPSDLISRPPPAPMPPSPGPAPAKAKRRGRGSRGGETI